MNTPSIPRQAAARGATRRPGPLPETRRASIGGAVSAGCVAVLLLWTVARAVRKHRSRATPPAERPSQTESSARTEVRDDAAPHFDLKPGPLPSHIEPREPNEMPRDGKRRTAQHLAGFGNLPTRPRRDHDS